MKDLLFVKSLHLPVFASQKPDSKSDEEWDFEHEQVCGFIRQFVDDNVYNQICNEKHARTLWSKLESLHASKRGKNKLFLLNKMIQLKFREGSSIADHLNEFRGTVDQLSGMGIKFDDEILGLWLLNTLPDSWETFRVSVTNSAPNGVVSFKAAEGGVLNEEMRRSSQASSSHTDVLVTENKGRSKSKSQDQNNRVRSGSKSKSSWVFDNGASFHVTSRKEFFTSYTPRDFGVLKMGNDVMSKVVGPGTVCLETNTRTKLLLKDVRHALDVRLHLISTSKLDDDGYFDMFNDGQLKLTKGSLVVARGKKSSGLYWLQASISTNLMNAIESNSSSELWHKRFYDPVEKKLVRSCDVIFVEDQTIEDIDKAGKSKSETDGLIDLDPTPTTDMPNAVEVDVQNDTQNNEAEGEHEVTNEVDSPIHEVVDDQQQTPVVKPEAPLRRSTRDRRASTRYSSSEYVLLINGEEPECYQEAIESEQKVEWVIAMKDEMQSLLDNHTFELVKLHKDKKALKNRIDSLKKELSKSFAMKDLGPAKHILGMKIIRDRKWKKLWLSQEK
ncbi:hypothetical protein GH714_039930 [Hevea brasiliensis]|uniref:Retrovirus-related Pol polyprotein from transposon TNT 1-94-like beta-barrel domain-containing protein n=1 Tax=Hevea brasiliensis TaxID=3981 RepID=A0A6A6MU67_HEVBR|nr:hypothetical protein GH714_039930 [Hevea brasiliensis]